MIVVAPGLAVTVAVAVAVAVIVSMAVVIMSLVTRADAAHRLDDGRSARRVLMRYLVRVVGFGDASVFLDLVAVSDSSHMFRVHRDFAWPPIS